MPTKSRPGHSFLGIALYPQQARTPPDTRWAVYLDVFTDEDLGPGRSRLLAKLRNVYHLSITRPLFMVSCFGSIEKQKHSTRE